MCKDSFMFFFFSNCEIKEAAEVVKDTNLAKLLYDKSCKIVDIDKNKFLINLEDGVDCIEH